MKLEIITPEKEYFSGEVEYVEIPGVEGHMGLLPGHAPLVTMLNDEPDEDLRYKVDKNSIPSGFFVRFHYIRAKNRRVSLDSRQVNVVRKI